MPVRFQDKRGTATQWRLANPVLADGEFGIESDTGVVKVGNGLDPWNSRPAILGSTYLPILGKAADSDKLDGLDSTAFLKVTDATATYLPSSTAATTYLRQDAPVSAATANAVVKRDAQGSAQFQEVNVNNQTSASSAARKDYVDAAAASSVTSATNAAATAANTALTNATGSTSPTRKLNYHWGDVTAFPTVGMLSGDTCRRTNLGNTIWTYDGVNWQVEYGAVRGKMWRTAGFSGSLTTGTAYGVGHQVARLSGGFAWGGGDNSSGASSYLTVPLDGLYDLEFQGYVSGGAAAVYATTINRSRTSATDFSIANAFAYKASGSVDHQESSRAEGLALKAGDKLLQYITIYTNSGATLSYYGTTEPGGSHLSATYVGPLNGATAL